MRVVKFIVGGLFIITALGMFAQKEIVAGLFAGILGAVILPPVSDSLKEKFKFWQSKGVRYVGYFALLAVMGITSDNSKFKQKMEVAEQKSKVEEKKAAEVEKSERETAENGVKAGVYNANGEKVGDTYIEEKMDDSDFWKNYSPDVKVRVHQLIKDKDCEGLQKEFNTADDNNQAQMRRTGSNNAELLDFIDNAMRDIGCYK